MEEKEKKEYPKQKQLPPIIDLLATSVKGFAFGFAFGWASEGSAKSGLSTGLICALILAAVRGLLLLIKYMNTKKTNK